MITLVQIYYSLIKFQYLILLPAVMVEGPIISIIAGFLIAQGLMNFYLAFLLIIIGDLAGDALYYALGRWGRDFGFRIFRINKEKVKKIEHHYDVHGGKTILLSKIAHGIGTTFLFTAGAVKMPFGKFIYYNIIGTIPKSFILILVGYLFGQSYARISTYFDYYAIFTLTLGTFFLITYLKVTKKIIKKEGL